jgi:hypothetical protein
MKNESIQSICLVVVARESEIGRREKDEVDLSYPRRKASSQNGLALWPKRMPRARTPKLILHL